jgi:anti-anti-sigma factor
LPEHVREGDGDERYKEEEYSTPYPQLRLPARQIEILATIERLRELSLHAVRAVPRKPVHVNRWSGAVNARPRLPERWLGGTDSFRPSSEPVPYPAQVSGKRDLGSAVARLLPARRRLLIPYAGGSSLSTLDATVQETEGGALVALVGELDYVGAAAVEAELERVEQRSPPRLVIDLRGVTFIDSSGLRLLLEADVRARKAGRSLVLVRGSEVVQRVFEISLLDRRLAFVDDPG